MKYADDTTLILKIKDHDKDYVENYFCDIFERVKVHSCEFNLKLNVNKSKLLSGNIGLERGMNVCGLGYFLV